MYHKNDLLYDNWIVTNDQYCSSQLEISISAKNLLNRDLVSKSDPQCVVYQFDGSQYHEICRTEVIEDNLNPNWIKKLIIPFNFNIKQQLRFEIFDFDPYSKNEFLGRADLTLAQIVAANGGIYKQSLKTGFANFNRVGGELWLQAEEINSNKEIAFIQFSANNLDKKDFFGKSDPYLVISRSNPDGSFSAVHRTETVKHSLNPVWRPFNIRVQTLCNGSYDRTLKIDCYDFDDGSNDELIGSFTTSLKQMTSGSVYECINEKKKLKKKGYKSSGTIKLDSISIETEVTFLDYIKAGTQIHFALSIDFTASNGDPKDVRSLHRLELDNPNSYEIALKAVGEILEPYSAGLMAAFGFGAKIGPSAQLSHHFPLNNNVSYPYCKGIDEVLNYYRSTLESVTLHGPTNFAPSINYAASVANGLRDGKHYFVLLIITDGVITDMNETLEAIVNASSLPLSIIIVGVGNADFSSMEFLDGDGRTLVSRGRRASRDIVQFVPMRKYLKGNWVQHQFELGRDVLAEVPKQLIQFMNSCGIKPNTGKCVSTTTTFAEPNHQTNLLDTSQQKPNSSDSLSNPLLTSTALSLAQPQSGMAQTSHTYSFATSDFSYNFNPGRNQSVYQTSEQISGSLPSPYNILQNTESTTNSMQYSSPAPSAPQF